MAQTVHTFYKLDDNEKNELLKKYYPESVNDEQKKDPQHIKKIAKKISHELHLSKKKAKKLRKLLKAAI